MMEKPKTGRYRYLTATGEGSVSIKITGIVGKIVNTINISPNISIRERFIKAIKRKEIKRAGKSKLSIW